MGARRSRTVVLALAALGLSSGVDVGAQERDTWQTHLRAPLPLGKGEFLTEPLEAPPGERYRIVLSGTFHFAHNDRTYDALYTTDTSGRFTQRHDYLVFSPEALAPVEQDPSRHRYVFQVPRELASSGRSIGIGIDLPRMVRDFLLKPNEVVAQLNGNIEIQIQGRAPVSVGESPRNDSTEVERGATSSVHYWIAALLLVSCAAVIWSSRRAAGIPKPLREQLQRIRARHAEVQHLLRSDFGRFEVVAEQVGRLREGAEAIVRRWRRFARLQDGLDTESLQRELAELELQQDTAGRQDVHREIAETLAEKRRLLDLLGDTSARQARYTLRLSKIEAVLESTRLCIPELDALEEDLVALHGSQRQQEVLERIQFEMRAVEEALRELERV